VSSDDARVNEVVGRFMRLPVKNRVQMVDRYADEVTRGVVGGLPTVAGGWPEVDADGTGGERLRIWRAILAEVCERTLAQAGVAQS